MGFQFAIDRGGTFTDVFARCPNGKIRVMKLLSVDPANYSDAPREGIRRILETELNRPFPPEEPIDPSDIEWIRMGTTVATNALLERKGEPAALLITKGFKDLLFIGEYLNLFCFSFPFESCRQFGRLVVVRKASLSNHAWVMCHEIPQSLE